DLHLTAQERLVGLQCVAAQLTPRGGGPDVGREQARGQLLRALASDAIRGALQRHFGVRIAFQNCHRVAVFPLDASVDDRLAKFTSVRGQLLNQSPELRDC
ncbi:SCO5389 family protein, partial [Streptomyces microflavus]|uniref:SCO5389 family protein n=1 Tax=Streptomyces microflavus TaxID=1919 RepID=UPI00339FE5A4